MRPDALLTVHAPPGLKIRRNSRADVRIAMTVTDGYHVQANPASRDFLIPLEVKLRPAGGIRPGKPVFPKAQPYSLGGMPDDPLLTYGGTFDVRVPLEAQDDASLGNHVLTGTIRYQACDSRTCLFPAQKRLKIHLEVL
jgi:hypothetical protein